MKIERDLLPDATVSGSMKGEGRNLGKGFRPSDHVAKWSRRHG